jgi:arsenate reductase
MTATLYVHPRCDTCRKARRWLEDREIAYLAADLTQRAPSRDELRAIQRNSGLPVKKLFNTSGQVYREGGWAERVQTMDDETMLAALAADGMLVKRPLLVDGDVALVGFNADAYARALAPGAA